MAIAVSGELHQLPNGARILKAIEVPKSGLGIPFTAEQQENMRRLEAERDKISSQLSAAKEENTKIFLGKAADALGLNPLQAEQIKPDLFRLVSGLDKLKGVDIPRHAKSANLVKLVLTFFGGFIGAFLAQDAPSELSKGHIKDVFSQRENLDKLEASLMETLKLNGEDGRAELRKKLGAFLEKEHGAETAKSYAALYTVKVFDPMQSFSNWLNRVFGGKDKLMSIAKSVKADVDKAIPNLVASAMSNDNAGAKKGLEGFSKGLLAKHRQDLKTALGAIREQVPDSVKSLLDEHIGLGAPSLKALPKPA